jgi:hypothetical protein
MKIKILTYEMGVNIDQRVPGIGSAHPQPTCTMQVMDRLNCFLFKMINFGSKKSNFQKIVKIRKLTKIDFGTPQWCFWIDIDLP